MRFDGTLLAQKAEPEEIQKADLDLLKKINDALAFAESLKNALVPVGMIYTQYPGMAAPSTLWPFGTWANVSNTFAGDFFRAEGGAASAFESGEQADQFQDHEHTEIGSDTAGSFFQRYSSGTGSDRLSLTTSAIVAGGGGTPRYGDETRPVNQTIRIWKRTA